MALCKSCGEEKPTSEFYLRKSGAFNSYVCKPCFKAACRARYSANRERYLVSHRRWKQENKTRHVAISTEWNRQNRERRLEIMARYRAKNKERIRAYSKEYIARDLVKAKQKEKKIAYRLKGNARCPQWANRRAIASIYKEARLLSRQTGVTHSVDHIVPLSHPLVCGLHVEHNLRVIPQTENLAKSNRWWPEMPAA
jgi:hypothetical protein